MLLEANIQQSLAQRELDLEDAMAIRKLKDVDQAERLLVVRRKKRIARNQQLQQQNIQLQAQANSQTQQVAAQAEMQRIQLEAQAKMQTIQTQGQIDAQILQLEYELKQRLESLKAQASLQGKQMDMNFRSSLEDQKDNRKDDRVKKQAVEQSKLISQRQGQRSELTGDDDSLLNTLMNV